MSLFRVKQYLILLVLFLMVGCSDESESAKQVVKKKPSPIENTPTAKKEISFNIPGTIAIGEFRLSGTAASGQYTHHLLKLKQIIDDTFSQQSDWTTLETERLGELRNEQTLAILMASASDQEQKSDQKKIPISVDSAPQIEQLVLPKADYILLGELDGFDMSIARSNQIQQSKGREITVNIATKRWQVRSSINLRLIDVNNRKRIISRRINIHIEVDDTGNAESQVNKTLKLIADRLVSETLQALAGEIKVVAITDDHRVMLNGGLHSGLRVGMPFKVYRTGKEITDPDTGKLLSKVKSFIGKIEIEQVEAGVSYAKITGGIKNPQRGDALVADNEVLKQRKRIVAGRKKVRVAIGGITWLANKNSLDKMQKKSLTAELEQKLTVLINRDPAFTVVEQDGKRINKMLAQQILTAINQDRDVGLPLGTIRGVDYLIFVSLSFAQLIPEKNTMEVIKLTDEKINHWTAAKGLLSGYVYLQDINTADSAARFPISVEINYKKQLLNSKKLPDLSHLFASKSIQTLLSIIRPLEILQVSAKNITLSGGKNMGLKIGQELLVYSQGEQMLDPYTGAILEAVGSQVKSRLQIIDISPQDYAIARLIEGIVPSAGETVKPQSVKKEKFSKKVDANNGKQKQVQKKTSKRPEIVW